MEPYPATIYELKEGLQLCVYAAEPDMHFPLSLEGSATRLLSWSILSGGVDGRADYLLLLLWADAVSASGASTGKTIAITTQFGPRLIRPEVTRSFSQADDRIAAAAIAAAFASLGCFDSATVLSVAASLAPHLHRIVAGTEKLRAKLHAFNRILTVEGIQRGSYIVCFGPECVACLRVGHLAFEGDEVMQTMLRLDVKNVHDDLLTYPTLLLWRSGFSFVTDKNT